MVCKNTQNVDEDSKNPSKKSKNNKTDSEALIFVAEKSKDKWENLLGFQKESLSSWNDFVKLLCRPSDPACLGSIRFLFGKEVTIFYCRSTVLFVFVYRNK